MAMTAKGWAAGIGAFAASVGSAAKAVAYNAMIKGSCSVTSNLGVSRDISDGSMLWTPARETRRPTLSNERRASSSLT